MLSYADLIDAKLIVGAPKNVWFARRYRLPALPTRLPTDARPTGSPRPRPNHGLAVGWRHQAWLCPTGHHGYQHRRPAAVCLRKRPALRALQWRDLQPPPAAPTAHRLSVSFRLRLRGAAAAVSASRHRRPAAQTRRRI